MTRRASRPIEVRHRLVEDQKATSDRSARTRQREPLADE
jgi:hypothetical protein